MPLRDWIPEPTIIMFGCQPFTAQPGLLGNCPVCKSGVRPGDDTRYCGKCGSVSPRIEARVRTARRGIARKGRCEVAEKRIRDRLAKDPVLLTERQRRRIWNGYRGAFDSESAEVTSLARIGREFLTAIGQEPNWDLPLPTRDGKVSA